MKKFVSTGIILTAVVCFCRGQGTVNFANYATGVDFPITNRTTGLRLTGPAFAAQLFYAAPGAGNNIDSYTPVNSVVPFQPPGPGAGYFLGGSTAIPGFGTGSPVSLIVAAFSTAQGSTYLASRANFGITSYVGPVVVTLGGGTAPPANLVGIPEPSVFGFLGFGGLILLAVRRLPLSGVCNGAGR